MKQNLIAVGVAVILLVVLYGLEAHTNGYPPFDEKTNFSLIVQDPSTKSPIADCSVTIANDWFKSDQNGVITGWVKPGKEHALTATCGADYEVLINETIKVSAGQTLFKDDSDHWISTSTLTLAKRLR